VGITTLTYTCWLSGREIYGDIPAFPVQEPFGGTLLLCVYSLSLCFFNSPPPQLTNVDTRSRPLFPYLSISLTRGRTTIH
jgi:hypothetical protein